MTLDSIGMTCHLFMFILCHGFIEKDTPKNFLWPGGLLLFLQIQADWQSNISWYTHVVFCWGKTRCRHVMFRGIINTTPGTVVGAYTASLARLHRSLTLSWERLNRELLASLPVLLAPANLQSEAWLSLLGHTSATVCYPDTTELNWWYISWQYRLD